MSAGDIANTEIFEVHDHFGTHVEVPVHMSNAGLALQEIPVERFVFHSPLVVDIVLEPHSFLIGVDQFERSRRALESCDFLMLRTGHEQFRASDAKRYQTEGPGLSGAGAKWLRENIPALGGVAIDCVSLGSYRHTDEALAAHQILLGANRSDRYVLIYEDVKVSALKGLQARSVYTFPVPIAGLSGSPCMIVAHV